MTSRKANGAGRLGPTPSETNLLGSSHIKRRREQIDAWELPTRPTKKSDTRAKDFGEIAVELDAIEPNWLRELVELVIERHLPLDQFAILKAAEESERAMLAAFAQTLGGAA